MTVLPDAQWVGPDFSEDMRLVVDSRLLKNNHQQEKIFFLALRGSHHDGHDFIQSALHAGASGFITDRPVSFAYDPSITAIFVKDVLAALIAVAKAWRAQIAFPIIGITGSIGKTSTKELLGMILRRAGKNILLSHGNQNTVLGICLTLWRLKKNHDAAVFEMGISKRGEMQALADILRPTVGVITYIGHSHSQGLGPASDISIEKRAIFSYFNEEFIGIIQGDQPELSRVAYKHPIIKFGKKMSNQLQVRKVVVHADHITCVLKIYKQKFPLVLPTTNAAFLNSMLAAVAVAYTLCVPIETILTVIQEPFIVPGRYEKKSLPDNQGLIIHDAYNASPESMKAALLAFEKVVASKKIAILGDMLELGHLSSFWHRQIGRFLQKVPSLTHLILVGREVENIKKTAPLSLSCILVPTWQEAVKAVRPLLGADTAVLVKASRSIALHNIVETLEKNIS